MQCSTEQRSSCVCVHSGFAAYLAMPLNLGDVFPNFTVETTEGTIKFHDFLGDR